jgi:ribosomal protein S18 acetylase RimI-like enzyme
MKLSTRIARADEKPAILRLYESAMKQHIETIWGWDTAWQTIYFDKAFSAPWTYIVEVDGRFAGYVQLDLGPAENYLRMIILSPECRSSGIGARLLAELLRISRLHGRNLFLRVFRTNLDAKRFYEREGWFVAADEGDFLVLRHEMNGASIASDARIDSNFEICAML